MMTAQDLVEIRSGYKWIKVKKFDADQYDSLEEKFDKLCHHHTKETEFLIDKCRQLAGELLEAKGTLVIDLVKTRFFNGENFSNIVLKREDMKELHSPKVSMERFNFLLVLGERNYKSVFLNRIEEY